MKNACLLILSLLLISSCNDDEPILNPVDEMQGSESFVPLQTGNYWIYETYKIDTLGNEELMEDEHRITIIGNTLIDGEVYHIVEDENFGFNTETKYLKDSLDYIVDIENRLLFSSNNFTDIILSIDQGPYRTEYSMVQETELFEAPAGDFECLNFKGILTNTNVGSNYAPREINNLYSEGIGLVSSTIFYVGDTSSYFERRLKEYYVQ